MDGHLVDQEPPGARPVVRQDLNLYPIGEDESGDNVWHLHDPLANKFYQMQERDVQLLALIGEKNAQEVSAKASQLRLSDATPEEVDELFNFLRMNNLVVADVVQASIYEDALNASRQRKWWALAARNPLFFRIPLVNPDRFLDATLPYVAWLSSRLAVYAFTVLGFLGFYLVIQQIDQFFATFLHFFSWSGLSVYFLALLAVKVVHELGHAYTAKAMGCRVPVIGVAFMVGWPILYTDTSDAWKVSAKSKRLGIGIAGVSVELAVAVISLFLWAITPDGSLRSAFFLLATTTWLLSVFVNFNPLMRFDGYYLLSDLLDKPNMEPRCFRMAKWWLRERLFGLGIEPAEEPKRWMVLFAFAVWTYRFFLFLGIALLVYNFFFKAAGIALFVVEIIYFILRPIYNEIKAWWELREQMIVNYQVKRTLGILVFAGLLLFVPWYSDVSAPATLEARSNDMFLPVPGRLTYRSERHQVSAGERLFEFESPELDLKIEEVQNRYEELSWTRSSLGFDVELRNEALIVESELQTQNQRLRSLVAERERLTVSAPFSGQLVDIDPELMLRDWLPSGQRLGSLVDPADVRVIAYLPEDQLRRIDDGMTAHFYPDSPEFGVIAVTLDTVEFLGTPELDNLYVASTFGGDLAVRESKDGALLTVKSHYKLKLLPTEADLVVDQVIRGLVIIDGHAESLFSRIRRRLVAIFIRETGF